MRATCRAQFQNRPRTVSLRPWHASERRLHSTQGVTLGWTKKYGAPFSANNAEDAREQPTSLFMSGHKDQEVHRTTLNAIGRRS